MTSDPPIVTPGQIRAARALLGWSQREAADHCNVGLNTISRLESAEQIPGPRIFVIIVETFKEAGIVFSHEEHLVSVSLRV